MNTWRIISGMLAVFLAVAATLDHVGAQNESVPASNSQGRAMEPGIEVEIEQAVMEVLNSLPSPVEPARDRGQESGVLAAAGPAPAPVIPEPVSQTVSPPDAPPSESSAPATPPAASAAPGPVESAESATRPAPEPSPAPQPVEETPKPDAVREPAPPMEEGNRIPKGVQAEPPVVKESEPISAPPAKAVPAAEPAVATPRVEPAVAATPIGPSAAVAPVVPVSEVQAEPVGGTDSPGARRAPAPKPLALRPAPEQTRRQSPEDMKKEPPRESQPVPAVHEPARLDRQALSPSAWRTAPVVPWFEHALHFRMGALDTPASVGGRNTYRALDLDGGPEYAVAYSLLVEPTLELELEVSSLKASGTQRNAAGSGHEANRLDVEVELTFLRLTAMRRLPAWKHLFAPWYGAGVNVGLVEETDLEWIGTGAGAGVVARSAGSSSSTAAGVHAGAGVDIYFGRTSALALTLDARYNLELISGSFDGEVNSAAFRVGLRWDFWPGTE